MKLVNGIRSSIGKVFNGKNWTIFLEVPLFPENFQWNEPKKHVPFTTQPEFPESLGKMENALYSMVHFRGQFYIVVHSIRSVTQEMMMR